MLAPVIYLDVERAKRHPQVELAVPWVMFSCLFILSWAKFWQGVLGSK